MCHQSSLFLPSFHARTATRSQAGRLKRDVLFVYDLELPADFVPTPVDGEVLLRSNQSCHRCCFVCVCTRKEKKGGLNPSKRPPASFEDPILIYWCPPLCGGTH